jgi:hypothetical protein
VAIAQLPGRDHAEQLLQAGRVELAQALDRLRPHPRDAQLVPDVAAVALLGVEGDAVVHRERARIVRVGRQQEVAGIGIAVIDQVGQDVEVRDVPGVGGIALESRRIPDVVRSGDLVEPVLHHHDDVVGLAEGRRDVRRERPQLRGRDRAQHGRRDDVVRFVQERLLQQVGGGLVTGLVVELRSADLGRPDLHLQLDAIGEAQPALERDVLGDPARLVRADDLERRRGQAGLQVGDRQQDVLVLGHDAADRARQQQCQGNGVMAQAHADRLVPDRGGKCWVLFTTGIGISQFAFSRRSPDRRILKPPFPGDGRRPP